MLLWWFVRLCVLSIISVGLTLLRRGLLFSRAMLLDVGLAFCPPGALLRFRTLDLDLLDGDLIRDGAAGSFLLDLDLF